MNLKTYIDELSRGGASDLAALLGIHQVYLSQLARDGEHGRTPSAELAVAIEKATSGAVTRQELRPNDFWKIWPDLEHLAPVEAKVA